ncbi:MAG: diaminopimelate epimerase [Acidobacteriaceae bacterium]
MSRIPFVKAHACGNDFLIIDEVHANARHADMARKLCSRNTGIGADGIEFLSRKPDGKSSGDFFLRLFNADGGEAELSGNGTRCVAAWLAASEGIHDADIGTGGGVRSCRLIRRDGSDYWIESSMGVPTVTPMTVHLAGIPDPIQGAAVNMGNPHFVLFPTHENFSSHGLTWNQLGALLAVDPAFPRGTNVEFVHILAPDHIAFRIHERGCGPTTSSGTGTSASAAASMVLHNAARSLSATAQGGTQRVVWPTNSSQMLLTGPAEIICTGEVDFPA